ncbi:serine hydrolase domain-containing protein [Sinomonas mesophila]|uniref:serine hydrolase domain-containing protein n=1 Tax=Sinomonas mesophila TaxID=1531955 RepID=UPI00098539DB|nr:serine hydrolase domain-containing protein [Sinomonas mesophila]
MGRRDRGRRRRRPARAIVALVLLAVATVGALILGPRGGGPSELSAAPAQAPAAQTAPAQTEPAETTAPQTAPAETAAAQTPPGETVPAQTGLAQTPPATAPAQAAGAGTGDAGIASSSGQPAWQDLPEEIEATVRGFLSEQGAAGIAVAVSTGADTGSGVTARYATALGGADAEHPWTRETRSAYRSITKSFVGTVVLQLVAEGRIGLDDPVAEWVPGIAMLTYNGEPVGRDITVRMALAMRTGLAEFSSTKAFSERLLRDYTGAFTDDELLGYALGVPLGFLPGTAYGYSNSNTLVLAEIVHEVTGQSWEDAVRSRILEPLGLSSVDYAGGSDPAEAGAVAEPYASRAAGLIGLAQVSPSLYGASGGLFGDVGDLLAWGRVLGSGQLLPPVLHNQQLASLSNPSVESPGSPYYTGYGLAAGEIDGWWGHTGTGLGYQALTLHNPATGTTIAILINTQLPNPNGPAILFQRLEGQLRELGRAS